MRLAVISDSHIHERETDIPESFRDRTAAADHTIHAGDFETSAALAEFQKLATELTAVPGNVNPDPVVERRQRRRHRRPLTRRGRRARVSAC
jgi:hypothetical protein